MGEKVFDLGIQSKKRMKRCESSLSVKNANKNNSNK